MNGWLYSYNINNPKLIGFFPEVFVIKTKQEENFESNISLNNNNKQISVK